MGEALFAVRHRFLADALREGDDGGDALREGDDGGDALRLREGDDGRDAVRLREGNAGGDRDASCFFEIDSRARRQMSITDVLRSSSSLSSSLLKSIECCCCCMVGCAKNT